MNKQKVFDHVVKNLLKQGLQSRNHYGCMYRSKVDGKDCKCAIGWLIPDEAYIAEFEGKAIACVTNGVFFDDFYAEIQPRMRKAIADAWNDGVDLSHDEIVFLDDLREIHDHNHEHDWCKCFALLAKKEGLEFKYA